MGLPALLTLLEGLVFEIATWLVLVPKTLAAVIRRPRMLPALAAAAHGTSEEQPDEYVSPVLLWLIVGVVPGIPMIVTDQGPVWIAHGLLTRLGFETSIIAAAALLLLGPLSFATAQVLVGRRRLARTVLRQPFAIQCGCFAPFFLGYFVGVAANFQMTVTQHELAYGTVSAVFLIGSLLWFLRAEYVVLRLEAPGNPVRVIGIIALGIVLWAAFIALSRLILLMVAVYYG
jgi:hypothetical protein